MLPKYNQKEQTPIIESLYHWIIPNYEYISKLLWKFTISDNKLILTIYINEENIEQIEKDVKNIRNASYDLHDKNGVVFYSEKLKLEYKNKSKSFNWESTKCASINVEFSIK